MAEGLAQVHTIGGPMLAAEALRLDLVDVVELLWCSTILGGGIPVLSAGVRRTGPSSATTRATPA